ncbi:MAG: Fic family protein [Alphaproteobacteria bacterium]
MRETGIYQTLGNLTYFIPHPLPPANPPLVLTAEILSLYGEASFALGQLNEMSTRLPDPRYFVKAYVIKEALLSSAIEGIHTTMIDVFTQPIGDSKPSKETQLVLNYTKALDVALSMLQDAEARLTAHVILRAHEALLSGAGEDRIMPGHFREHPVQVGGLIPPPTTEISKLMGDLEQYMNEHSYIPPLIRAGLAHIQFETIHPFLDGNGRIGRLLIVLMLMNDGILKLPILYPSYYFKKYHFEYYQLLDRVRTHGDFEGWIVYYLEAIRDSAIDAHTRAKEIEGLEVRLKDMIQNDPSLTKIKDITAVAINFLCTQPITRATEMSQKLGKSYNTVRKVLDVFIKHGLVSEVTTYKRNKLYRFDAYLTLLEREY